MKKQIFLLITVLVFLPIPSFSDVSRDIEELIKNGNFDKALVIAEEGLADDPSNNKLLLQKGFVLINLKRFGEAEAFYLDLVSRMPEIVQPYVCNFDLG
ncbi:MAG: tetratricopeptide repeat protein [Gammaproteobacteria bacterium]|nr:tetratricopeptide repeat protein [Gammaproteobacteria bacterium]